MGRKCGCWARSQKVSAAARRFQKSGINTLGFVLDEVEHRLNEMRRSEHLSVVGDAFF